MIDPLLDETTKLEILMQGVCVALHRKPSRSPWFDQAQPKSNRVHLLSHHSSAISYPPNLTEVGVATPASSVYRAASFSVRTIVIWLLRFLIGLARPIARGRNRLIVGP